MRFALEVCYGWLDPMDGLKKRIDEAVLLTVRRESCCWRMI
jgi:hypothetical protein